jgi:hypothetical protein
MASRGLGFFSGKNFPEHLLWNVVESQGEDGMQTHQIHISGARERVHVIRNALFAFPEVLEVFVTGPPDVLVVVCAGRPRPGEWLRALRALGYRTPARGHAAWPLLERRRESLLPDVVPRGAGADDGDRTTSSIRNGQASRRRRDAA